MWADLQDSSSKAIDLTTRDESRIGHSLKRIVARAEQGAYDEARDYLSRLETEKREKGKRLAKRYRELYVSESSPSSQ